MPVMPWFYLLLAGACEMVWPLGYKYTGGFSKHYWAIAGTFAVMIVSLGLMALATRGPNAIHIGTAYAVWTGIGAVGAFVTGVLLFGDSASALRIASIGLIVAGIIGLKLA